MTVRPLLRPWACATRHLSGSRKQRHAKLKSITRRGERVDSVTERIVNERERHAARLEASQDGYDDDDTAEATQALELARAARLKSLGLGQRKSGSNAKRLQERRVGACGAAKYMSSSNGKPKRNLPLVTRLQFSPNRPTTPMCVALGGTWPTFKHMLPEVALSGHSNCGKVRDDPPSLSDPAVFLSLHHPPGFLGSWTQVHSTE